MESHVMSWNGLLGLVGTGIILYLGDLIIRYRQRHRERAACVIECDGVNSSNMI